MDRKRLLGVLSGPHKYFAKCLHYEPYFLLGCSIRFWLPILGIGSEISSYEVRVNVSSDFQVDVHLN